MVDTYVWQHTVDGSYSVKSAYMHCMTLAANMSNVADPDQNWNIIWKQKVPPQGALLSVACSTYLSSPPLRFNSKRCPLL